MFAGQLPVPLSHQDIGDVGFSGHATSVFGTFTINGSGADIGASSDSFHYVYQTINGDGEVVARVATVEQTDANAKAGVMIRESLEATSRQASVVITPSNGVSFVRRIRPGSMAVGTAGANARPAYWVKLIRHGDTIDAYQSPDGASWALVGTETISMTCQRRLSSGNRPPFPWIRFSCK